MRPAVEVAGERVATSESSRDEPYHQRIRLQWGGGRLSLELGGVELREHGAYGVVADTVRDHLLKHLVHTCATKLAGS